MTTLLENARGAAVDDQVKMYLPMAFRTGGVYFTSDYTTDETEWQDRIAEIEAMYSLEDDWDGEGSPAPATELVAAAVWFAKDLQANNETPPDRVVPGVDGTILFEWHTPQGYREVELETPMTAENRWIEKGSRKAVVEVIPLNT
jgi:hypothetical protein